MINIILKEPLAVPPYGHPGEASFTCDELTIKLDPYEQDYIRIGMISSNEIGVFIPGRGGEECVYSRLIDEP